MRSGGEEEEAVAFAHRRCCCCASPPPSSAGRTLYRLQEGGEGRGSRSGGEEEEAFAIVLAHCCRWEEGNGRGVEEKRRKPLPSCVSSALLSYLNPL